MECFEIRNLTFTYPEQDVPVLRDVSLFLRPGDFAVLAGASGCGKSTLLRQLKTVLAPHGHREGTVLFDGIPLEQVDGRTQAAKIGYVLQDPDAQIVTDKVWHELAFGLESLGLDSAAIRSRVAEMACFFGIQNWFHRSVAELSGGQKQLLNLASVMVLQPDVLILDEPTSQLDPIAAGEFLQTLVRINRELGTAVLLCEHRLEDVLPLATRLVVLDGGAVLADDAPAAAFEILRSRNHSLLRSMPTPMVVWSSLGWLSDCPLTVSEGKQQLTAWAQSHPLGSIPEVPREETAGEPAIALEDIWFRHEKDGPDILKGLSLAVYPGELLCILGGNGTGKTTALSVLSGVRRPGRGRVGGKARKIAALPQDPRMLLVKKNVREELMSVFPGKKPSEAAEKVGQMVSLCRLEGLLDRHPYDLSGGEQQRTALAKVLLQDPEVLLLDEPTKGVDNDFKAAFAGILKELTARGVCVIMVSHDVEFCARYAHRCGLFFDGGIAALAEPRTFFAGNRFYTTAASRMAGHLLPRAVTPEDIILACGGKVPPAQPLKSPAAASIELPAERRPEGQPLWRRCLSVVSGAVFGGLLLYTSLALDLSGLYQGGDFLGRYGWLYGLMFFSFGLFTACVSRKPAPRERRLMAGKLTARTRAALLLSLILIPLTIWAGLRFGGGRRYLLVSLAIIAETMVPFFLIFEGRRPQARELVILSVLSALAIGGRAVFFAMPGFKPVAAMVILTGVAFGPEAGFMVGAMTMFCSNVLFAQGPWTPWQMFAMGVMGLLAGLCFRKGLVHRERFSLSVFGGLVVFLVYGGIMNPASVLMYQPEPDWQMILTAYITGVPADAVHALATVLFLWFLSEPMLEKLDRVKVKYGLVEKG